MVSPTITTTPLPPGEWSHQQSPYSHHPTPTWRMVSPTIPLLTPPHSTWRMVSPTIPLLTLPHSHLENGLTNNPLTHTTPLPPGEWSHQQSPYSHHPTPTWRMVSPTIPLLTPPHSHLENGLTNNPLTHTTPLPPGEWSHQQSPYSHHPTPTWRMVSPTIPLLTPPHSHLENGLTNNPLTHTTPLPPGEWSHQQSSYSHHPTPTWRMVSPTIPLLTPPHSHLENGLTNNPLTHTTPLPPGEWSHQQSPYSHHPHSTWRMVSPTIPLLTPPHSHLENGLTNNPLTHTTPLPPGEWSSPTIPLLTPPHSHLENGLTNNPLTHTTPLHLENDLTNNPLTHTTPLPPGKWSHQQSPYSHHPTPTWRMVSPTIPLLTPPHSHLENGLTNNPLTHTTPLHLENGLTNNPLTHTTPLPPGEWSHQQSPYSHHPTPTWRMVSPTIPLLTPPHSHLRNGLTNNPLTHTTPLPPGEWSHQQSPYSHHPTPPGEWSHQQSSTPPHSTWRMVSPTIPLHHPTPTWRMVSPTILLLTPPHSTWRMVSPTIPLLTPPHSHLENGLTNNPLTHTTPLPPGEWSHQQSPYTTPLPPGEWSHQQSPYTTPLHLENGLTNNPLTPPHSHLENGLTNNPLTHTTPLHLENGLTNNPLTHTTPLPPGEWSHQQSPYTTPLHLENGLTNNPLTHTTPLHLENGLTNNPLIHTTPLPPGKWSHQQSPYSHHPTPTWRMVSPTIPLLTPPHSHLENGLTNNPLTHTTPLPPGEWSHQQSPYSHHPHSHLENGLTNNPLTHTTPLHLENGLTNNPLTHTTPLPPGEWSHQQSPYSHHPTPTWRMVSPTIPLHHPTPPGEWSHQQSPYSHHPTPTWRMVSPTIPLLTPPHSTWRMVSPTIPLLTPPHSHLENGLTNNPLTHTTPLPPGEWSHQQSPYSHHPTPPGE
ncbi:hypothetical protein DPMN_141803 [Dreissena polymorpha]|uniref:Uncharacterized protein n=1 Tax=Dreissena polymorpha TaxID=45954 RepID=A0A9D4JLL9_DREPO|nr:hypothetical protein DPMN_141803 [Dreissena polymorpha]